MTVHVSRADAAPSRSERLAAELGGTLDDRFLTAERVRLRSSLEVRRVVLDELAIDVLATKGHVLLAGCRIGTLRLTDVVARGGILIEDCEIGNLVIRNSRHSTLSLVRLAVRRAVVHECGSLVVDSSAFTELVALSDVQGKLEISRSTADAVRVSADGTSDLSAISLVATTVRDRVDIVGVEAERLDLHDIAATRVQLRHVRVNVTVLSDVAVERALTIQGLSGKSTNPKVAISGVLGSVSISTTANTVGHVTFRESTLRGDLVLGCDVSTQLYAGCTVEGTFRPSQVASESRVQVAFGASVRAVQPPAHSIRSPKTARAAAVQLLGGAGVSELSILRDSLAERPDEQDMAYFALRKAEQDSSSGLRRAMMWLRGQCFGWGVTFIHPLRTFFAAILVTSSIVFALNPGDCGSVVARSVNALTSALGLWFNVATGMPDGLTGPGWQLAAVGCTALGIAIIAVLTGVAIRRLTR